METSSKMRYMFYCWKQHRFGKTVETVQQVRRGREYTESETGPGNMPQPKTPEIPCCRQNIPTYLVLINRKIRVIPPAFLPGYI